VAILSLALNMRILRVKNLYHAQNLRPMQGAKKVGGTTPPTDGWCHPGMRPLFIQVNNGQYLDGQGLSAVKIDINHADKACTACPDTDVRLLSGTRAHSWCHIFTPGPVTKLSLFVTLNITKYNICLHHKNFHKNYNNLNIMRRKKVQQNKFQRKLIFDTLYRNI
jgi:hypothetical protein